MALVQQAERSAPSAKHHPSTMWRFTVMMHICTVSSEFDENRLSATSTYIV